MIDWSAWTANLIALAGIAYTWWANRGTRQSAAAANAQATESLRAAQEAAAAQERMAEVMEKIYEAQERQSPGAGAPTGAAGRTPELAAAVPVSGARWRLVNISGSRYLLTNVGAVPAYDVRVTASQSVRLDPPARAAGSTWNAGDGEDLAAQGSWGHEVPTIVVTWRDTDGGAERSWERVIPR